MKSQRTTRTVGALLGASVALGALAACGTQSGGGDATGDGGTTDGSGDTVTLTLLQASGAETWEPVIDVCEAALPTIRVEQQVVPFTELIAQIQSRLGAQDSSIDLIATDPPRIPSMASKGWLADVSDDLPAMEEALLPASLTSVTWEGKQYAYPIWTSDVFVFYNKELLDAAGIAYPGPSDADRMTWEELTSDAAAAVAAGAANGMQFEQVDRFYPLQPVIASAGGGPGLTGDGNLEPEVDTPAWVEFGEWYRQIHADGTAPKGIDATQTRELFTSGQLAYFISIPAHIPDLQKSELADGWGMAPLPYFEGGDVSTPTDSWSVGVSAYSEKQEAAREFARCATLTAEGAMALSSVYALPPVHQEALPAYFERIGEIAPDATAGYEELFAIDTAEHAVHRPASIGYVEFETIISKAFADMRNGGDPASVLSSTQDSLERQLSELR
ncbi:carbohydrate ABC transporter substrate-binding protein (CUT1 family) [Salana multivorans]|uniref:Carbohydrate ABC transporter substrate-binding protein (CUT1 family) n=1 Tax=Salana multivorans TaxID=120377 RepID=A0A3N2D996_9MICO|nr:extracellular solute-binding protein [Salana multivorans]ROR96366.1 carbohydrate ABC transporter substrate-binding protein (CUT1 family) [Salana multivorans]